MLKSGLLLESFAVLAQSGDFANDCTGLVCRGVACQLGAQGISAHGALHVRVERNAFPVALYSSSVLTKGEY